MKTKAKTTKNCRNGISFLTANQQRQRNKGCIGTHWILTQHTVDIPLCSLHNNISQKNWYQAHQTSPSAHCTVLPTCASIFYYIATNTGDQNQNLFSYHRGEVIVKQNLVVNNNISVFKPHAGQVNTATVYQSTSQTSIKITYCSNKHNVYN